VKCVHTADIFTVAYPCCVHKIDTYIVKGRLFHSIISALLKTNLADYFWLLKFVCITSKAKKKKK